jgi:hypothetical protein
MASALSAVDGLRVTEVEPQADSIARDSSRPGGGPAADTGYRSTLGPRHVRTPEGAQDAEVVFEAVLVQVAGGLQLTQGA